MTDSPLTQQALNKAMMEAVDFIHAEGWDAACERMAASIEALGWERFTYRAA